MEFKLALLKNLQQDRHQQFFDVSEMDDQIYQQYNGNLMITRMESLEDESLESLPAKVTVIPGNLSDLDQGITLMTSDQQIAISGAGGEHTTDFYENSDIRIINEELEGGGTLLVHQEPEQFQIQLLGDLEAQPAPRDEDLEELESLVKGEGDFFGEPDYQENFVTFPAERENYLMEKIDIKDLKLLKPLGSGRTEKVRENHCNYHNQVCKYNLANYDHGSVKPTQWYQQLPRPMAMNTFDMRYLAGGGGFILSSQKKIIEVRKSLQKDTNFANAKTLLNNRFQIFNRAAVQRNAQPMQNGNIYCSNGDEEGNL
jgi:hypothetical protein